MDSLFGKVGCGTLTSNYARIHARDPLMGAGQFVLLYDTSCSIHRKGNGSFGCHNSSTKLLGQGTGPIVALKFSREDSEM